MSEQPNETAPGSDGITVEKTGEPAAPVAVQAGEPVQITPVDPTPAGATPADGASATTDPASSAPGQGTPSSPPSDPDPSSSSPASEDPTADAAAGGAEPTSAPSADGDGVPGDAGLDPEPAQPGPAVPVVNVPHHLVGKVVVDFEHVVRSVETYIQQHPGLDKVFADGLHAALGALEKTVLK